MSVPSYDPCPCDIFCADCGCLLSIHEDDDESLANLKLSNPIYRFCDVCWDERTLFKHTRLKPLTYRK